jgi:peptidoglycan/xylan/chitin deacetylase (PgdA/CDA1 family)
MSTSWTLRQAALERVLLEMMFRLRLDAAGRRLNTRHGVIVMYHGFTDQPSHDGIANHECKHVTIGDFVTHLELLKRHYNVIPLADLVRAYTAGIPLPLHPAVVTIDDGYRSTYNVAYPALRQLGIPAAVFLATAFVDGREYLWTDRVEYAIDHAPSGPLEFMAGREPLRLDLKDRRSRMMADRIVRSKLKKLPQDSRTQVVAALEESAGRSLSTAPEPHAIYEPLHWDEIHEMADSGLVTFGGHTHTHLILSRCDEARALHELQHSKQIIEDRLDRPCDLFCYPNGRHGDFSAVTKRLVKASGYSCALTTVYGMNAAGADVYELKRYNLGKPMIRGEVEVRLSGLMELPTRMKQAARRGIAGPLQS